MENVLKQPLNFSQKWTQQAIDDKMQEIKVRKINIYYSPSSAKPQKFCEFDIWVGSTYYVHSDDHNFSRQIFVIVM